MKKIIFAMSALFAIVYADMLRDDNKSVMIDTDTQLMWQDDIEAKTVQKNWGDAKKYCETLSLGGYKDWFLPTSSELRRISDDTMFENIRADSFSERYWTVSPSRFGVSGKKISVYYSNGGGESDLATEESEYFVRCARDSTGTGQLLARHNDSLKSEYVAIKEREIREAQEKKDAEQQAYAQAQERQRIVQEKNRKSAEGISNFIDGIVSLSKGVNDAMENTAAKFYGLTPDQCKRVKIYYGTSNIGRRYKVLQGVSNGSKFDFQCTAAQIGATAIINANANCSRAAVVKSGFFSNSLENEETCTYTGTAVK